LGSALGSYRAANPTLDPTNFLISLRVAGDGLKPSIAVVTEARALCIDVEG
jgi:hypothetical protein